MQHDLDLLTGSKPDLAHGLPHLSLLLPRRIESRSTSSEQLFLRRQQFSFGHSGGMS
jgi:hypothetical protein